MHFVTADGSEDGAGLGSTKAPSVAAASADVGSAGSVISLNVSQARATPDKVMHQYLQQSWGMAGTQERVQLEAQQGVQQEVLPGTQQEKPQGEEIGVDPATPPELVDGTIENREMPTGSEGVPNRSEGGHHDNPELAAADAVWTAQVSTTPATDRLGDFLRKNDLDHLAEAMQPHGCELNLLLEFGEDRRLPNEAVAYWD